MIDRFVNRELSDRWCPPHGLLIAAGQNNNQQSREKRRASATTIRGTALPKTEYGAAFYPWIEVSDPLWAGRPRTVAPCGTIAGLFARTDSTRGVWKAPAGTDALLNGVRGVNYKLTDDENGLLNPLAVNCIRVLTGFGIVSWGSRTLRDADQMTPEYK